ncbi:MAG: hypothetical protein J4F46_10485 [Dehalococcoidia bacterium]|nr:hypothetical protein [Dehalococcoidia bacterium]
MVAWMEVIGSRVVLAFIALGFLIPAIQAISSIDGAIAPGCDLTGGERAEAVLSGENQIVLMGEDGGMCITTASDGDYNSLPTGTSLTVAGGVVTGGTWAGAEDTSTLLRLLDTPLALGLGVIMVFIGAGALILL